MRYAGQIGKYVCILFKYKYSSFTSFTYYLCFEIFKTFDRVLTHFLLINLRNRIGAILIYNDIFT